MKRLLFLTLVITASIALLTATQSCDNFTKASQATTNEAEPQADESPVDATDGHHKMGKTFSTADNDAGTGSKMVAAMVEAWKSTAINVDAGSGKPGIKQFALAFCNQYQGYKPCAALSAYLTDKQSDPYFNIEDKTRQGYIACRTQAQFSQDITCCYWNCNNGHCLVAFWLDDSYENGDRYTLPAFYDYDPSTQVMTPRTELTTMVENRMKTFDEFSVELPSAGKDIILTGHKIDHENDCTYNTDVTMKWNGNGFKESSIN